MYLHGPGWKYKQKLLEDEDGNPDSGQVHAFIGIGSSDQEMQQLHLDGKVCIRLKYTWQLISSVLLRSLDMTSAGHWRELVGVTFVKLDTV